MGEKSGEAVGEGLEAAGGFIKSTLYTCMKFSTQLNKKTLELSKASTSCQEPHPEMNI